MRKVTGYIGALIVVIALMGSILAGYALNINGQSTVVNEYENVTDVSGLYSHTDQKTYIDYNPASNYIGYSNTAAIDNTFNNSNHYKKITSGHILTDYRTNAPEIYINNSPQGGMPLQPPYDVFICDYFRIYAENNGTILNIYAYNNPNVSNIQYAEIDIDDSGITVTFSGTTTYTYPACKIALCYTKLDTTWDYGVSWGTNAYTAYLTDVNQVITSTLQLPTYYNIITGNTAREEGAAGVNQVSFVTENSTYYGSIKNYTLHGDTYRSWSTFYPRSVSVSGLGIDYTESNRVNNYIVGYREIGGTPVTTSSRIDLQNVSTYNYATPNKDWIIANTHVGSQTWTNQLKTGPIYTDNNGYQRTGGYIVYKMSDVLTSIGGLGENTKTVTFSVPVVVGQFSDGSNAVRYTVDNSQYFWAVPYNFVVIGNQPGTYDYDMYQPEQNPAAWTNLYRTAVYDVETGLVNIYDVNGAKILTDNISNIYIQSISNPGSYGLNEYHYTDSVQQGVGHYYMQRVPVTVLDVTVTTSTSTSTPIYIDITKGIKIDPANVSNTIWNNEYENGQIQLLFRAEDTYSTYHNEMSISSNSISVDYTSGRFFISLNNEEPIDVGAWRSIILNIDLLNGDVSVNPVRTFNSYTNVSTDKAVITIGDMVNPAPTTTITWKPTPNSFTFSVYRTDVFLNTYGVVMVNPSLNITNYFTDLNNFYRLVLNNFSTYGDSITVNGVTGNVSGNTVTFNDEPITLKNLEIIYADGHVYVEDDNDSVDLGTIANNDISLSGVWYFETDLDRGYTATKQIYTWDWTDFILNNTQFCIFYIGMALVGLVVARRFCIMSVIDYAVFITSIIIALSTQVIA